MTSDFEIVKSMIYANVITIFNSSFFVNTHDQANRVRNALSTMYTITDEELDTIIFSLQCDFTAQEVKDGKILKIKS